MVAILVEETLIIVAMVIIEAAAEAAQVEMDKMVEMTLEETAD
jgi:hypothetical protein